MNKTLFDKVKSLCKDTGLSEKYLKAITEKLGGSVEDDSTDEAAIETAANLIADVAKESQGESSRWVDAFKKKNPKRKDQKDSDSDDDDDDPDDDPDDDSDPKKKKDPMMKLLKKMQKQMEDQAEELKTLKGEKAAGERNKTIQSLMETHKIPKYLRDTLAKSIAEGDDAEQAIKDFKQGLITNGLETEEIEGKKVASEKQVDEAADSLLESITAK